jgi:peptidoglycan hydrolase CwlO-like protein
VAGHNDLYFWKVLAMSQPVITPGDYSLTELADLFQVSRKTAERYIPRYSLNTLDLIRYNKTVTGVSLTQENISKILSDSSMSIPLRHVADHMTRHVWSGDQVDGQSSLDTYRMRLDSDESRLEEYKTRLEQAQSSIDEYKSHLEHSQTRMDSLQGEINLLKDLLLEEKLKNARLDTELKTKHDVIALYEQRIHDKDTTISALQKEASSHESRANAFNNQISGMNNIVHSAKTADAYMSELVELFKGVQGNAAQETKKSWFDKILGR